MTAESSPQRIPKESLRELFDVAETMTGAEFKLIMYKAFKRAVIQRNRKKNA